ncbi:UDP-glucose 4-epimerase [Rhizoctonia solani]|uniref:UDP-glucose 4-epimerase n=1 Tax=Rhizoctonia solani TaxID=456999 RepID=A0A8H7IAQ1_9AGAM|nr:UDP-glucose 4-epimerase [Rhizoctonia solani]
MSSPQPLRRVLVTGGAGYIGSHVVLTLALTRRYKVFSIDNHHNSFPEALNRVSKIARDALPADASQQDRDSAEVEAYTANLTNEQQVRAVFDKFGHGGVWGVIHVAAYKAVGESGEIPLTYYANNVSATILLAQIMKDYGCTNLVYSSSATVYGIPPVVPIPETTPLKAESVYGRTKVMCETLLKDLCHAEANWRVISLRYFNPAGAHPSGLIGEDPRGRPGNLLPLLSQMAVGRVKDSSSKSSVTTIHSGYNLGKGRGQSVLEIVQAMRVATGHDYKTEIVGRRLGDVPDLTADPALAEKELGFRAPKTWRLCVVISGIGSLATPKVVNDSIGPASTLKGTTVTATAVVGESN